MIRGKSRPNNRIIKRSGHDGTQATFGPQKVHQAVKDARKAEGASDGRTGEKGGEARNGRHFLTDVAKTRMLFIILIYENLVPV